MTDHPGPDEATAERCGYCGTPEDGKTWCCRLRYENSMEEPRLLGAWVHDETERQAADELARLGQEMGLDEPADPDAGGRALLDVTWTLRSTTPTNRATSWDELTDDGRHLCRAWAEQVARPQLAETRTAMVAFQASARAMRRDRDRLSAGLRGMARRASLLRQTGRQLHAKYMELRAERDKYRRSASDAAVELGVALAELAELRAGRVPGATELSHPPMWWDERSRTLTIEEDHRIKVQWRGAPGGRVRSGSVPVCLVRDPSPRPGPSPVVAPPNPSIPLGALKALAQGEPLDAVAGDYGVPLDVVKAAAPFAGRRLGEDGPLPASWFPEEAETDELVLTDPVDTHPPAEQCIHCATPARLASVDPVVDCAREECPHTSDSVRCGHDRRHGFDDGACVELDPDPTEVREWLDGATDPGDGPVDSPARLAERIRGLKAVEILRRLVRLANQRVHDDFYDRQAWLDEDRAAWTQARAFVGDEPG